MIPRTMVFCLLPRRRRRMRNKHLVVYFFLVVNKGFILMGTC